MPFTKKEGKINEYCWYSCPATRNSRSGISLPQICNGIMSKVLIFIIFYVVPLVILLGVTGTVIFIVFGFKNIHKRLEKLEHNDPKPDSGGT